MRNGDQVLAYIKARLLMDHPFFGSVASSMRMVPDSTVRGFSLSHGTLRYNPAFVLQSPLNQCTYDLARVIIRAALSHWKRRGSRDRKLWNLASEIVASAILEENGLASGIPSVPYSRKFSGMSVEEVYSDLWKMSGKAGTGPGDSGEPDTSDIALAERISASTGISRDLIIQSMNLTDDGDSGGMYSAKMKEILASARLVETMAGKHSVPARLFMSGGRSPIIPWMRLLDPYLIPVEETPSMRRFSRKYIDSGIYLPYRRNLVIRAVVIMDVSASISPEIAGQFWEEVASLGSGLNPGDEVEYIQADADAVHREILSCHNRLPGKIRHGNGGTDFTGVFRNISQVADGRPVVLLTDGRATFPDKEPGFPLICISTDLPAPYGINYIYGDFA